MENKEGCMGAPPAFRCPSVAQDVIGSQKDYGVPMTCMAESACGTIVNPGAINWSCFGRTAGFHFRASSTARATRS
ncbi:MAG: hypothetical protein ACI4QC_11930 [Thermoguttaceae bacterium]